MNAEEYLNKELKDGYQVYDDTGDILISGIQHSEICRIMEQYHKYKLVELLQTDINS